MESKILSVTAVDIRFPTSLNKDGSDAMVRTQWLGLLVLFRPAELTVHCAVHLMYDCVSP